MYRDYKIIFTVFCGRRDRTSILLRYIDRLIQKGLIDEVHLWDYCRNEEDRKWLQSIPAALLHTCERYMYEKRTDLVDKTEYSFRVSGKSDVHILFACQSGETYELCLGAFENTRCLLRRGVQGIVLDKNMTSVLDATREFQDVQVQWKNGMFTVILNGETVFKNATIPLVKDPIVYAMHSTGFGSNGVWDIPVQQHTRYRYCKALKRGLEWRDYYEHYHKYRHTLYANAIICKCDDDIVCIDTEHFHDFLNFRIDHPEYSLVFPNIVNNGVIASYQQHNWGVIPTTLFEVEKDIAAECGVLWESSDNCQRLHDLFLKNPDRFSYPGHHYIPPSQRVSINFFAVLPWMLEHFANAGVDDEKYLSKDHSMEYNKNKALYNQMFVVHFSFCSQEYGMDIHSILGRYKQLANQRLPDTLVQAWHLE